MSEPLQEIARRAAHRALAERGLSPGGGRETGAGTKPASPEHVLVQAAAKPPAGSRPGAGRGRTLIDVDALSRVGADRTLVIPHGAVVTPLATEEAQRRGVRLVTAAGSPDSGVPGGGDGGALRVALGCDHGGFALKQDVLTSLRELGARPVDFGTRDGNSVDYPDFAQAVAEAVASGQCDLGVVIDGAGIGSAIAANKVPGVRAATCTDERMASNAREHNHANVLSIGSGWLSASAAHGVLRAFLTTPVGPGRHARRVAKIDAIERRYTPSESRR